MTSARRRRQVRAERKATGNEAAVGSNRAYAPIGCVEPDRNLEGGRHGACRADVIGVSVGGEDGDGAGARGEINNSIGIGCRVHDQRRIGFATDHEVGVVAERAYLRLADTDPVIVEMPIRHVIDPLDSRSERSGWLHETIRRSPSEEMREFRIQ